MKKIDAQNYLIKFIFSLLVALLWGTSAFAKEIDLYDQPKTDAKVIGKIDLAAGVIPIFTPKEGRWVKVGDPRNGNVGWVKSNEMNSGPQTTVTFTQRIINDGNKGPQTYQIIRYGQPPQNISSEQVQNMMQKMQTQQQAIQQSMQKAFEEMMKDFDTLYQGRFPRANENFPVIMPIVIIPAQKGSQTSGHTNTTPSKPLPLKPVKVTPNQPKTERDTTKTPSPNQ